MRMSDTIRRAGRSLRQAKARTFLTSLAIAVGAFTLTLSLAAGEGARQYADKIISSNIDPAQLLVSKDENLFGQNGQPTGPTEYDPDSGRFQGMTVKRLNEEDIKRLTKLSGVESVQPQYTINPQYVTRDGQKRYTGTVTVYNPGSKPELASGSLPEAGQLPKGAILLPDTYLTPLGFTDAQSAIGKKVIIQLQRQREVSSEEIQQTIKSGGFEAVEKLEPFETTKETFVIGAVTKRSSTSFNAPTDLFVAATDAKRMDEYATKGTDDFRKYIAAGVRVSGGEDFAKVEAVQNDLKKQGFTALSARDAQKFLFQVVNVLQGIVAGFGVLALIASVFGIINTQYISVLERTQQIGLMKALGMRRRDVSRLFRFEAAWIGFLGGIMGAVLATATGLYANPWITKQLELGEGNYLLIFQPLPIAGLIGGLMLVAILAGLLPARKAAKLDPIEALRTE